MSKELTFTIGEQENKNIEEWKELIKNLYGEYGTYTYKFTPTGIGNNIQVYSHLAKIEKDFTIVDNW
jgi:hypothetical protein